MHKLRVYVDTSVFGGIEDDEFTGPSRKFFEQVARHGLVLIVSAEVLRELQEAPESIRCLLEGLTEKGLESIPVSPEIEALANAYVDSGVLGRGSESDAVHVAAATVSGADVIVSWNFRHIVNLERIRKYNAVNALKGYPEIEIRSPAEIAYGYEDEDL